MAIDGCVQRPDHLHHLHVVAVPLMRDETRPDGAAIDAGLAPHVRQLSAEYSGATAYLDAALSVLPDAGAELEEFATDGTTSSGSIDRLDQGTRQLIDLAREAEFRKTYLDTLQREISQGNASDNPAQAYRAALEDYRAEYAKKTARQRYAQHPAYIDFRSRIWEVHGDGAMPPLIDAIPVEPGDEHHDHDEGDEDIVVGGTLQQFRCPLTASLLEDPVESTVCSHAYSRAAITEFIENSGRRNAQCPAAACRAVLTLRTLRDAPSLKRRVERYARQTARREEERRGMQWAGAAILD